MFTTYPSFKHPVQFGSEAPAYLAVELTLIAPWLIAECQEGDYTRTFLLDGLTELNSVFLLEAPFGPLDRLSLIFPPTWSATREWNLVRIKQIQRVQGANSPMGLVLIGDDGSRFMGMPIAPCVDEIPPGLNLLRLATGPRE